MGSNKRDMAAAEHVRHSFEDLPASNSKGVPCETKHYDYRAGSQTLGSLCARIIT